MLPYQVARSHIKERAAINETTLPCLGRRLFFRGCQNGPNHARGQA